MIKRIYLAFSLIFTFGANAQYLWDYGFQVGASNYLGEMGGKEKTRRDFVADMKLAQTRWDGGAFVRYKINSKISVKAEVNYLRIKGDDKLSSNPGRRFRNLNFKNDIFELYVAPQLTFYENNDLGSSYRFRLGFKSYLFAGVGVFYHSPKTLYNDEWVKLRPLMTEGKSYSKFGVCIPAGAGFYFTMKRRHRVGFEFNWRTTFTDYLDDVSTVYASPSTLGDPLAIELANRTDEIPLSEMPSAGFQNNFLPGNKRGDPTHKDSYMTMMVNYSYVIRGRSSFYRSRYGSFFKKKARKKFRKIRAKF